MGYDCVLVSEERDSDGLFSVSAPSAEMGVVVGRIARGSGRLALRRRGDGRGDEQCEEDGGCE